MKLSLSEAQRRAFLEFLKDSEDAEILGGGEYTADLYDLEPPVSLELLMEDEAVEVLAAAELKYDEGLDGWYLGERITQAEPLQQMLTAWLDAQGR